MPPLTQDQIITTAVLCGIFGMIVPAVIVMWTVAYFRRRKEDEKVGIQTQEIKRLSDLRIESLLLLLLSSSRGTEDRGENDAP